MKVERMDSFHRFGKNRFGRKREDHRIPITLTQQDHSFLEGGHTARGRHKEVTPDNEGVFFGSTGV
jgi:hypothetical protein